MIGHSIVSIIAPLPSGRFSAPSFTQPFCRLPFSLIPAFYALPGPDALLSAHTFLYYQPAIALSLSLPLSLISTKSASRCTMHRQGVLVYHFIHADARLSVPELGLCVPSLIACALACLDQKTIWMWIEDRLQFADWICFSVRRRCHGASVTASEPVKSPSQDE